MTISGDPADGGSYNLVSAGPDEPTVNVGPPAVSKLLVASLVFRALVGFLHDIAPGAQRLCDAGKPCFFGGRKAVHVVTDFVEHIDDVVDALERVVIFPSSPLEKSVSRQVAARSAFASTVPDAAD